MRPDTEKAYRAWRAAAERGYGLDNRVRTPGAMERVDARIRSLKERYERLLAGERVKSGEVGT